MSDLRGDRVIAGIDRPVMRLALGTAFFTVGAQEAWFDLLDAFVACGGTLIDSGRVYGDSEEVIGQWMASRQVDREGLVLITKGAHGKGVIPESEYPQVVHQELDTSLGFLQTDYVDLYFLHRDNMEMPVGEILEPLNEEIERGRVRAIGASNWEYRRLGEAAEYADKHGLTGFGAVSNNLSLARPAAAFYPGLVSVDAEGERWHADTGVGLIPWSSQARGFFTGQWTRQLRARRMRDEARSAPPAEKTFDSRMLKVYATDENYERLERARALGERKGEYTAMEVGLAWLLNKPFPIAPVVGARNREELDSCVRAAELTLTADEASWLDLGDET